MFQDDRHLKKFSEFWN